MLFKRSLLVAGTLALLWPALVEAEAFYRMRVDGLACPFCAYGIEQKLEALEGVEAIHIDLNEGTVEVRVTDATHFTRQQMKQLYNTAGFTFRSMERKAKVPEGWPPQK